MAYQPFIVSISLFVAGIIKAIGGIFLLYLIIVILPLFMRLVLKTLLGLISSFLRIDLSNHIDILLFPGSMLRVLFVWLVMSVFGYKMRLSFILPRTGSAATNLSKSGSKYLGMTYYAYHEGDEEDFSNFKLAVMVSLASYAMIPLCLVMILFSGNIIYTMHFFLPAPLVVPIFTFLMISFLFGGLPVPEETMGVVNEILYDQPHRVINLLLNIIATAIIAPHVGIYIATVLFMGYAFVSIMISKKPKLDLSEINDPVELLKSISEMVK